MVPSGAVRPSASEAGPASPRASLAGPLPAGWLRGPASAPRPDLTIQRPWRLLEQRLSSSSPAPISLNAFLRDGTLSGQVKGSALLRGPD